jgi:1,4-dihydroxy-2-naphthoate octaprenyltransferase
MASLRTWIDACRPKTLVAAAVPVAVGGAVVHVYGRRLDWPVDPSLALAICLGFALCVQVACNFANDLGDTLRGADTSARIGPRRAVANGDITSAQMKVGIWVACLLALVVGSPVGLLSPWLALAGVLAIVCALGYTLGPYPLAYNGLGDVFVIACFGVQATALTAWAAWLTAPRCKCGLCGDPMPWTAALLAGLGLGLLADNILVANNARDYETDVAAGKRTTVVRFGRGFARGLFTLNLVGGLACLGLVFGWLPLLVAPWALKQAVGFRRAQTASDFVPFLAQAAALLLVAGALCVTASCLGWVPTGFWVSR